MAERAQVTSVEAIESFRANLILYLKKARATAEEVSNGVVRTRVWLQNDQRRYWQREIRVRRQKLERAQQELLSANLSRLQEASAAQLLAVRRAQEAVREAEAKLSLLKRWDHELENRSEPLVKSVDQLRDYLASEMPRAVAHLTQVVRALEAYTGTAPPGGLTGSADSDESPDTRPNESSSPDQSPESGAADPSQGDLS